MGAPTSEGPSVSGEQDSVPPLSSRVQVGGLAPERDGLLTLGFPEPVVMTMQEAQAPSTRAAYSYPWEVFTTWCGAHQVNPYSATSEDILLFLQNQLEAGKSALLQGMVVAIKAVHVCEYVLNEDGCSLISCFLRGAQRLTAGRTRPSVPPWDLDIVLGALRHPLLEPYLT